MKTTDRVAQSFEKVADDLDRVARSESGATYSEMISLRASLRGRATQVRQGQLELDRAKHLLDESGGS